MTISEFSIRRPVFAWMLMAGLILFGWISYERLGISQMPDIDFPVLEIRMTWEGAAPDVMESELVDMIEQKVIAIQGLKEVRSSIRQGSASIKLEFDIKQDINAALQETQGAVSQVRLPLGVDTPTIRKSNPEDEPVMWVGLTSDRPLRDLIQFADESILDQFQIVQGVGEIRLGGFSERNLRVWASLEKLNHYELTILDLLDAIQKEHSEIAAGSLENAKSEINLRSMGEGLSPEEISRILVTRRAGKPIHDSTIRVGDVARVEDGLSDIKRMGYFKGKQAITIGINKQRGSNEVEVAKRVREFVADLNGRLPKDIQVDVVVDFTRFTESSVQATKDELIVAALLTGVVCWLFLGSWSSAFNVLLAIPTSIVGTFMAIYFAGFTLNVFTLLALTLVIGIVVDDAIMMLENIVRHKAMGKSRWRAALDGSHEIVFAAIVTSVAIIAIFAPVIFMEGVIGKFFFQFGVTLSVAVALSLLEAVTLTPMRCSQFLQGEKGTGGRLLSWLTAAYRRALEIALGHRWKVTGASLILFGLSLALLGPMKKEFVPQQDQNIVRLMMTAPPGTSLQAMNEKCARASAYLESCPEVKKFFMSVGGFDGQANKAFSGITLLDRSERQIGHIEFMKRARAELAKIPGLRVQLQDLSARGLTAGRVFPVAFNIRGPDYATLNTKSQEILKRLNDTGLVLDMDTDYREGQPEVRIVPDRAAAALRGVSVDDIGKTVSAAIGGVRQGKFTNNGRRYDLRVRLEEADRLAEADILKLRVHTAYGEMVPLSAVAKTVPVSTVQNISRVNRQRSIALFGSVADGKSQSDALDAVGRVCAEVLPAGYSFHFEGGSQAYQESFKSLWFTLWIGVVIAYMVLASQFNSFIHPITILLALPFSLSGALATLWAAGFSLNLFSMVGVILLMGIVKKNSILLVEFTNQLRERGRDVRGALLEACPIRLRPILMTTLATVGAAAPVALGLGPGSETRAPMASAVIGGVLVSMLFTLFVVPCAYSLFSRLERPRRHEEDQAD